MMLIGRTARSLLASLSHPLLLTGVIVRGYLAGLNAT
jgi:hypothetical protein